MNGTIAAVATSTGVPSGINIIRISGGEAENIIRSIFVSSSLHSEMEPNRMYLGKIQGENFNERAFCVLYKAPKSYTGEDVAEIHCHGGKGVTSAILRLTIDKGASLAEAGEFTRRAFLNGKLTLAEAEGVADMINAETEGQVRNAYRLMSGELTAGIESAEKKLVAAAAMLEAKLDYPEELEEETNVEARRILKEALDEARKLIDGARHGKIVKNGADIAIIGIPNAGKSSLLNAILKTDRAIVTSQAGTTRDVVKESIEYKGIKLNFLDTAGIREGGDEIERIGIAKSVEAIKSADIAVFLADATVSAEEEREIERLLQGANVIRAVNKTDVNAFPKEGIQLCARTGENVEALLDAALEKIDRDDIYANGVITNERHLSALRECERHLTDALDGFGTAPSECTAVDVYSAAHAIGKITGSSVREEVIEEIFSRFCVGK